MKKTAENLKELISNIQFGKKELVEYQREVNFWKKFVRRNQRKLLILKKEINYGI